MVGMITIYVSMITISLSIENSSKWSFIFDTICHSGPLESCVIQAHSRVERDRLLST